MSAPTMIVQVWNSFGSVIDQMYPPTRERADECMRDVWSYQPTATQVTLHPLNGSLDIGPWIVAKKRPVAG